MSTNRMTYRSDGTLRAQHSPNHTRRPAIRIIGGGLLGIALLCAIAAGLMAVARVRLNTSPSLPLGLYRDGPGRVMRGSMVVACLPRAIGQLARVRHYLGRGTCPGEVSPVGKIVLAIAGDTVAFTASGLEINDRRIPHTAPQSRDYAGRLLPHYPFGTTVLQPGTIVLYAPHARSFDSRYYGPIELSKVRAVIRPLWTSSAVDRHVEDGAAGGRHD